MRGAIAQQVPQLLRSAPVMLALAAGGAVAQVETAAVEREEAPARLEVSAVQLPRLAGIDSPYQQPRVDVAWMRQERSGFGPMVGVTGFTQPSAPPTAFGGPRPPALDLGMQWRYTFDSNHRIDISAWRRVTPVQDAMALVRSAEAPVYGARVELNLSPAGSKGLVADRGFLGFQLESGARISLRRKDGHPMLYYRSKF